MAQRFVKTGGNFSTLTFQKVVATSYPPITLGYGDYDALNTTRYLAFTPSENGTMEGAMIAIRNASDTGTNYVTVTLQEDSGGGFADVVGATCTLTLAQMSPTHNYTLRGMPMWVYFTFTTPKAITAVAARWRLKVLSDSASVGWVKTPYAAAIVLQETGTFTSGDELFFCNEQTFTVDSDLTTAQCVLGVNTHIHCPSTVASSCTWGGTVLYFSKDCRISAGEDDTHRVPYAKKYTIAYQNWLFGEGYSASQNYEIELWGEKPTSILTYLDGNVAASQATITVDDDMSAIWIPTDEIVVAGSAKMDDGAEVKTIGSISGKSIVATSNYSQIHYSDWFVVNKTRAKKCGIEISSWNVDKVPAYTSFVVISVSGVYLSSAGKYMRLRTGAGNAYDYPRIKPRYFDMVVSDTGAQMGFSDINIGGTYLNGGVYKHQYQLGTATQKAGWLWVEGMISGTVEDIYSYGKSTGIMGPCVTCYATNSTLNRIQGSGGYITSYTQMVLGLINCTVKNVKLSSTGQSMFFGTATINTTVEDSTIDGSGYYGVSFSNTTIGTKFKNCSFGQDKASTIADIQIAEGYFAQVVFEDCKFTNSKEFYGRATSVAGSYLRSHNHEQVTDNHWCYEYNGNMTSCGTGLTDTTCHTAGGLALRFEPTSSTIPLKWEFSIPTGNIQNKTMMVGIWCKINSATYYSGTHQLPRLTIDYDNGTVAYAQATATTDWQFLALPFTPTSTYGQISVTVSAKTDATATDAYVYFDDFKTLFPAETPLNTQPLDLWANGLPVTPPLATVLSANDVWSASSTTDYGDSTMGKHVSKKLLKQANFIALK